MKLEISENLRLVLQTIEERGHLAFVAGLDLCNIFLNRNQHLCTVFTTADNDEIRRIFRKCVEKDSCMAVSCGNMTYYIEHIDDIESLVEDMHFSMYSIYYSLSLGIVDNYGGVADIERKIVRCIGDYEKYFAINPILMVRTVAIAATLGFCIDDETKRALKKYAVFLKGVRLDLLLPEINKILLSDNPDYIKILNETMLLRFIMPHLSACFGEPQRNKYHIYDVGEHIMHAVKNIRADKVLRWAALLHDIGKPLTSTTDDNGIIHFYGHHKESKNIAEGLLRKFRMDSDSISDILILIENHDVRIEPTVTMVKRLMSKTGPELFLKLMELQEADNKAKNADYFAAKKNKIEAIKRVYNEVIEANEPYMISHLMINAKDLAKLGLKRGRMTTDLLKTLLNEVIVNPSLNNREYLIKRAHQIRIRGSR